MTKNKNPVTLFPFLFYVRNGVIKSNRQMPKSGEGFEGWLSATHIIRNQKRHKVKDVHASLNALKSFIENLKPNQEIKEKDLLKYVS